MTDLFPVLYLHSKVTIQGILKRYITISWVNWLRNGELSKSFQYIWRTLYVMDIYKILDKNPGAFPYSLVYSRVQLTKVITFRNMQMGIMSVFFFDFITAENIYVETHRLGFCVKWAITFFPPKFWFLWLCYKDA